MLLTVLSISWAVPQTQTRIFDREAIESYKSQAQFAYASNLKADESWLGKTLYLLWQQLLEFLGKNSASLSVLLFRLLVIGLIIAAIVLIVRLQFGKALSMRSASQPAAVPTSLHISQEENYPELAAAAVAAQDWTLAIRYTFLGTLVGLHQTGKIKLDRWKTAHDYAYEVPPTARDTFEQLSQQFEVCWYGTQQPLEQDLLNCQALAKQMEDA